MSRHQPRSLTNAILAVWGLVALSGLTALLTLVLRGELVRRWEAGRQDVGTVQPPEFVPVAIVLFIVFAALAGVLVMFVRDGHSWARVSLSVLVVFMAVATLAGLRTDPPVLFLVLALASAVLDAALLFFLWHRDTSTYIRGAWLASHGSAGSSSSGS
jgi:hypothetical protein